jgi:hypothetical protein
MLHSTEVDNLIILTKKNVPTYMYIDVSIPCRNKTPSSVTLP